MFCGSRSFRNFEMGTSPETTFWYSSFCRKGFISRAKRKKAEVSRISASLAARKVSSYFFMEVIGIGKGLGPAVLEVGVSGFERGSGSIQLFETLGQFIQFEWAWVYGLVFERMEAGKKQRPSLVQLELRVDEYGFPIILLVSFAGRGGLRAI